jgi:hypothetical protein
VLVVGDDQRSRRVLGPAGDTARGRERVKDTAPGITISVTPNAADPSNGHCVLTGDTVTCDAFISEHGGALVGDNGSTLLPKGAPAVPVTGLGPVTAAMDPNAISIAPVQLLAGGGGGLIGNDGGTLIGNDGSTLVSENGLG